MIMYCQSHSTRQSCEEDVYCMCYMHDHCDQMCYADSMFLTLDLIYYILFGLHCCLECAGYCRYGGTKNRKSNIMSNDYICCVYICQYYRKRDNVLFEGG
eukprot:695087_1